jgi:hypothetical protein
MISPYEQKTTIKNNRQAQAWFERLLVETRAFKDILRRSAASADRHHEKREASSANLLGRSKPPPSIDGGISSLRLKRSND